MTQLASDDALRVLEEFHTRLDVHFRSLSDARTDLPTRTPVYALEHGLSSAELENLRAAVRLAVKLGFTVRHRQWWLPFVVHASESGYEYEGDEYWYTFERATPGWSYLGDRNRLRTWFRKFRDEYGGAEPRGAFAANFTIIAWPITHAVLPVYLQRSLAQLLYEFRMGLTGELLKSPDLLGSALAPRARGYTERFRVFCDNTSLLGQVAAALLSGQGEDSPYLDGLTLARIVEGLERERQAKYWLGAARQAANRVRAHGLHTDETSGGRQSEQARLPSPTDPRLVLRKVENGWQAYAQLPDLRALHVRLPSIFEELRSKRGRVEGTSDMLARGRLAASGQQVRLSRWPRSSSPFVQLENVDAHVNAIIAEQATISRGPFWLFKRRTIGFAVEVKGKVVHPGETYYVVHDGDWNVPDVEWAEDVQLDVDGVFGTKIAVPDTVAEADVEQLVAAGLSVVSDIAVRPVGLIASAWDGEGSVEWLAGETGLVGIRAQQLPVGCSITIGGEQYTLDWPAHDQEMFLALEDLGVGTHELLVALIGNEARTVTQGSLLITIREPQVRDEGGQGGEGIRLLASPARPTMSELWEPNTITIEGTDGLSVDIALVLRDEKQIELARIHQPLRLPMLEPDWAGVAKKVQSDQKFGKHFDQAESIELTVSKAGVGHASLTVDRGFQPLRWQLHRNHDGEYLAHLIDRTDSGLTTVDIFKSDRPLVRVVCDPKNDVQVPIAGGLLRAQAGELSTTLLLPTRPNELWGSPQLPPSIDFIERNLQEAMNLVKAHHLWASAEVPGDVFAQRQREVVLEAITRSLVSLIAGSRWTAIERSLANAKDPLDYLESLQQAVGEATNQKELAKKVADSFYAWLNPAALLSGFGAAAQSMIVSSGVAGRPSMARFLLTLAGRPGLLMEWDRGERAFLLDQALKSPALLRAARFAVVGTRAFSESAKADRGF